MIYLRAWKPEDASALYELCNDPNLQAVWDHHYLYPNTLQAAISCINFYLGASPRRFLIRAILNNHQVCGYIQCEVKDYGKAEIAYFLSSTYQGKGIMSEVIPLFCESCFFHLPINLLYARVKQDNIASSKVLMKNQFKEEKHECIYLYYLHK